MSDTEATSTESTEATEQSVDTAPEEQLGEGGKKALDAERKRANAAEKAAKAATAELQTLRNAALSDTERAKAEAEQYKTEAAQARADALRYRIATKHGISDEDAELFLTATDEDTLVKQAERLAGHAKTQQQQDSRDALTIPGEGSGSGATPLNSNALEDALKSKLGIQ